MLSAGCLGVAAGVAGMFESQLWLPAGASPALLLANAVIYVGARRGGLDEPGVDVPAPAGAAGPDRRLTAPGANRS